jgi:PLD-like domain
LARGRDRDRRGGGSKLLKTFRLFALAALFAWFALAVWNSVKPLPPGTQAASPVTRLAESQVAILDGSPRRREILAHELAAIDRAAEVIVLDLCPMVREVGLHLLARKRQRPNLKIVLIVDPLNEAYGGTPAQYLSELERAGVIVARARLNRMRDSNPLYTALWRLGIAWWSDPYDEAPGEINLRSTLRRFTFKADDRQLIVADDGSGGWRSIVSGGTAGGAAGDIGLELTDGLARDIAASELAIAAWSTDDDRLPPAPPAQGRGLGSIDARFLTEGAIRSALLDAVAGAAAGDEISFAARALSDRPLIDAALRAAERGARIQVLLDREAKPNRAVAGELSGARGQIELRWFAADPALDHTALAIIRHRGELWVNLGAADFTRLSLDDFNLEVAVELRLPVRAAAARTILEIFSRQWSGATADARLADDSRSAYWRYRLLQAAGLAGF